MDSIWLYFAGFTLGGTMLGYGLCLLRHRKAINRKRASIVPMDKWEKADVLE